VGCDAAKFLDPILEAFDQVALSVNGPAVGKIDGLVRFRRDAGTTVLDVDDVPNPIGSIGAISEGGRAFS
jgi:hypothetical protein